MKQRLSWALAVTGAVAALSLAAQEPRGRPERAAPHPQSFEPSHPRANQGHVPPAPVARADRAEAPRPEIDERSRINNHPHVSHDQWYGHDRPDDPRFHLDHPFEHGHFPRTGPDYRWPVVRFDPDRHWFWFAGGFFFEIAAFDWALAADWCWTCGDDFVIYDDPDHPGWYLLYDVHTGVYIHVQYLGT